MVTYPHDTSLMPRTFMTALSIKSLHKTYDNGFEAIKGISLEVANGDFFALLGANGAGKSTTIGIISSLINKSSGEVRVLNKCLDKDNFEVKQAIGLVPQEFNCNIFEKCEEILLNQAGFYGLKRRDAKQRTEHYLKQLGLWEKRHQTPRQLSGGMKRRLMIARALVHQPKILILDEPTAGVDVEIRHSMWKFLQELNQNGTTIILTTHYLEEAEELCRNIAIIDQGKIIEHSSMQTLLQRETQQTLVLDIRDNIRSLEPLQQLEPKYINDTQLEIVLTDGITINHVFNLLSKQDITVTHIKNKGNRLENLFLSLIKNENNQ